MISFLSRFINISDNKNGCSGYSLLELLLSMVVGSVILAATYSTYVMVSRQYNRIAAFSQVHESGISSLQLLSRDIRMAGYKAVDASLFSTYGTIATPISITDSGDACCDEVTIIYDKSTTERLSMRYYTAARTSPVTRQALFLDLSQWDGASWVATNTGAVVADYIEDFQVVGSDLNADSIPKTVDISLTFRSTAKRVATQNYTKPSYNVGNYNLTADDMYHRDEFNATINVRNVQ
ncbi:prepilin-type N-terminal cleavage/methylation domain-containing protein [Rickettsiales bacterium]|nr:prepilin-type N-terminal cleavage/methylation domain-containing protein [Rickettsiales bacterium]